MDAESRDAWLSGAWLVLVVFAIAELGILWLVAWWLYVILLVVYVNALRPWESGNQRALRINLIAIVLLTVAVLYFVSWSPRKPFLRDLYSIQTGMSEADVRVIMAKYVEGTGWPANPLSASTQQSLHDSATGKSYPATNASDGTLVLKNNIVFRYQQNREIRIGVSSRSPMEGVSTLSSPRTEQRPNPAFERTRRYAASCSGTSVAARRST